VDKEVEVSVYLDCLSSRGGDSEQGVVSERRRTSECRNERGSLLLRALKGRPATK
jgi:hypothetical protein